MGNVREILNESSVKTHMAKKGSDLLNRRRWRKIGNEFDFCWIHLDSFLRDDMPKDNAFSHHKVTFLLAEHKVGLDASFKHLPQIFKIVLE